MNREYKIRKPLPINVSCFRVEEYFKLMVTSDESI